MSFTSAIYEGWVRHRRWTPEHAFTFPLFMAYLDLAEVDEVLAVSRWWGREWWRPARFVRSDYLRGPGGAAQELDGAVRDVVEAELGERPRGPVRMLTHLRCFGYVFNPVTFYYCFGKDARGGERVEAIVAEITNTPWGEMHAYVLDGRGARRGGHLRWGFDKVFHVSPFMPMDLGYDWAFTDPNERLTVQMNLRRAGSGEEGGGGKVFDATLRLERRELTPGAMRSVLARYPLMAGQVIASIHFEALKLWLKGAKVHRHPGPRAKAGAVGGSGASAAGIHGLSLGPKGRTVSAVRSGGRPAEGNVR